MLGCTGYTTSQIEIRCYRGAGDPYLPIKAHPSQVDDRAGTAHHRLRDHECQVPDKLKIFFFANTPAGGYENFGC